MSLAIKREVGDRSAIAHTLNNLGTLAAMRHEWPSARACFEEALELQRGLGDRAGIASILANMGEMAELHADHESALGRFRESLSIRRGAGDLPGCIELLESIAGVSSALGQISIAAQLSEAAQQARGLTGTSPEEVRLSLDTAIELAIGDQHTPK
jgi:tetratricopeptide (TPR) repeat protein